MHKAARRWWVVHVPIDGYCAPDFDFVLALECAGYLELAEDLDFVTGVVLRRVLGLVRREGEQLGRTCREHCRGYGGSRRTLLCCWSGSQCMSCPHSML